MADKTYMLQKDAVGIDAALNNSLRYDIEQKLSAPEKARVLATLGIDASKLDFAILGYFDTFEELEAAITTPEPGDAYGVGMAYPYDIYIWDDLRGRWINNGPIRGADGEDGKDAELSAESITAALGYVPANADEPVGFDKLKRDAKTLAFENIIIPDWAWEEVGVSQAYPWRAAIDLPGSGVDASYEPTVVFDEESLTFSELGNFCTSFDNGVFVYAASAPETLIKVLTLTCEPTLVEPLATSVFGVIAVTYGAGKTLICTDGVTTLTAKTTSGSWQFAVPSAGMWLVSDGENEQSVNITTQGQRVSVTLAEPIVPAEYQAVEYLEFTGTEYINTGITPSENNIQVSAEFEAISTAQTICVFGTSDAKHYHLTPHNGKWYVGTNGTEYNGGSYPALAGEYYNVSFNDSNHAVVVNGSAIVTGKTYTSSAPIKIGTRDSGGDATPGQFRYYSFQISNNTNGEILRNFVPCYRKADNVAGLWDSVSETFFTNAGTGNFVVGPAV